MLAVIRIKAHIKKLIVLGLALICFLAWYVDSYIHDALDVPEAGYVLEVVPGASSSRIIHDLANDGLVEWPSLLVAYLKWSGGDRKIKAGEYQLLPGITLDELLQKFYRGDVILHEVTLVEGWTVKQVLQHLCAQSTIRCTLNAPEQQLASIIQNPAGGQNFEGLLFPDTYRYTRGTADADIVKQANLRLQEILEQAWNERALGLPLQNSYQALILASIVEKETSIAQEREQVAGVFIRRLLLNMRLQTDPTVIYGLGNEYAGNITREHLQRLTPYNTYRIDGLPPTPIALAGAASIRAALHPDGGDAIYFVARGDGSHVFAATLEEHNRNVVQFQKKAGGRASRGVGAK
jgi:UPF0755 protein